MGIWKYLQKAKRRGNPYGIRKRKHCAMRMSGPDQVFCFFFGGGVEHEQQIFGPSEAFSSSTA